MSVLLKPPAGQELPQLALVAGVAVADALERLTGLAVQIKWPNDVMLRRAKVCGILAEARDGVVVLGIGLNLNQRAGRAAGAGRLAATRSPARSSARDAVLDEVLAGSATATRSGSAAASTRSTTGSAHATSSAAGG